MNDMTKIIVPKSDQINSDDLISGPRTITITGVDIRPGQEQPVAISFEGDDSKVFRPCKSMSRVLVAAWGPDAKAYIGRSVTLYRDPKVKWGGMEVGGIRISHLSHIETALNLALTATKGKRTPYIVKPLQTRNQSSTAGNPPAGAATEPNPGTPSTDAGQTGAASTDEPSPFELQEELRAAATMEALGAVWMADKWKRARKIWDEQTVNAMTKEKDNRKQELSAPPADPASPSDADIPF